MSQKNINRVAIERHFYVLFFNQFALFVHDRKSVFDSLAILLALNVSSLVDGWENSSWQEDWYVCSRFPPPIEGEFDRKILLFIQITRVISGLFPQNSQEFLVASSFLLYSKRGTSIDPFIARSIYETQRNNGRNSEPAELVFPVRKSPSEQDNAGWSGHKSSFLQRQANKLDGVSCIYCGILHVS